MIGNYYAIIRQRLGNEAFVDYFSKYQYGGRADGIILGKLVKRSGGADKRFSIQALSRFV